MSMKPKRTLGPAAFEAYMNFADSLKDGTNNDSIDRFKYRFAVKEGYIRPKKARAMTESAGGLSLEDFETAFKGLVGGFLPHLDDDDQEILGRVCENLDRAINSGDFGAAQDAIKGAMRDAGGDPDEYGEEEYCCDDDGECEECEECDDDDECPAGKTCKAGKCVDDDSDDESDDDSDEGKPAGKKGLAEGSMYPSRISDPENDFLGVADVENQYDAAGELSELDFEEPTRTPDDYYLDYPGDTGDDGLGGGELPGSVFPGRRANSFDAPQECCCGGRKKAKANAGTPRVDAAGAINTSTPGFGVDDTDAYMLGDETGDDVVSTFDSNDDMNVLSDYRRRGNERMASDYTEDFEAPSDVDYDALADMILSDSGYDSMTVANGGVGGRNRELLGR